MNNRFAPIKNKRWMLVDDDAGILSLAIALVENLTDAEIEPFCSPQAALAAFAATPEIYELVITDFEMPVMDGVELCRQLRRISPPQKIILATGSGVFTEAAARHAGFCGLLNKPFLTDQLHEVLAQAGVECALLAHA